MVSFPACHSSDPSLASSNPQRCGAGWTSRCRWRSSRIASAPPAGTVEVEVPRTTHLPSVAFAHVHSASLPMAASASRIPEGAADDALVGEARTKSGMVPLASLMASSISATLMALRHVAARSRTGSRQMSSTARTNSSGKPATAEADGVDPDVAQRFPRHLHEGRDVLARQRGAALPRRRAGRSGRTAARPRPLR